MPYLYPGKPSDSDILWKNKDELRFWVINANGCATKNDRTEINIKEPFSKTEGLIFLTGYYSTGAILPATLDTQSSQVVHQVLLEILLQ